MTAAGNLVAAGLLVLLALGTVVLADEKIYVHVVPHTHDDVGWLKTVDEYFYGGSCYTAEVLIVRAVWGVLRGSIYVWDIDLTSNILYTANMKNCKVCNNYL